MASLSSQLLKLFGLGQLNAVEVGRLAKAAREDGWGSNSKIAKQLAQVSGNDNKNAHRKLMTIAMHSVASTVRPYEMKLEDGSSLDICLPHEIVPALIKQLGGVAEFHIGDKLDIEPIGAVLRKWASHPDIAYDGDPKELIALGIHYDGVQYTAGMRAGGSKSIQVASLNVLSASKEENRQRRLPLMVLRKSRFCGCGCGGFDTLQSVFEVVAWSFRCLADGVAPSCRHDGSPFTASDKCIRIQPGTALPRAGLVQVRGDWEGLVQFFRLRSYNSEFFCWQCNATASSGPHCYKDFSRDAGHRATKIDHQQYLEGCALELAQPSFLFRCPGFDLGMLVVDSMHSADLGCFADAVGSIFWLEMASRGWHQNQAEGLKSLNKDLEAFYRQQKQEGKNPSKVTPLSHSQIVGKSPGYPFLKAKAAQCRHLGEFGLQLANDHMHGRPARDGAPARPAFRFPAGHRLAGREADHLQLLVQVFQGMAGYTRSLSTNPFDPTACRESMLLFLSALASLHTLWREGLAEDSPLLRSCPFALRPKAHMLQHLVQDHMPDFGSPAKFWCYRDEDFVGCVKSICSKTKMPSTLERRVLQKLRLLFGLGVHV
jgi:hypothetical protein